MKRTPGGRGTSGAVPILLDMLDEAFARKSWHGPNLRGAIRG